MNVFDYADAMGLEIRVTRYSNQNERWSAQFAGVYTADHPEAGTKVGTYGNGKSAMAAIRDYVEKVAGKCLIFNPHTGGFGKDGGARSCPMLTVPS